MTTLDCRGVSVEFGGRSVLSDACLTVQKGAFVSVVGANGSGKTTLLNVICGIVPTRRGQVLLNGTNVTGWSPEELAGVGLVRSFEEGAIWSGLSVLDNVALGLWGQAPLKRARDIARSRADDFGLSDVLASDAGDLSLGQRRRMELARLMVRMDCLGDDVLLVLDEPSRGLDHSAKVVLSDLMHAHLKGRCTVVMVEHDLELATRLSTQLVTISDGRVCKIDRAIAETPRVAPSRPASQGPPALTLSNIRAGYSGRDVLRDVSFSVSYGEAVQLMGVNGSGKTTLLRVIVGGLRQRAGSIAIGSGRLLEPGKNRLGDGLGYAPQGGRLISDLTVAEHLDLAQRSVVGRSQASAAALQEALPELTSLRPKRVGLLSSGQRSLVSLWVALSSEPSILVADETGAGLAPNLKRRVYDFIRLEWLNPRRALVFVEHGPPVEWARPVDLERGVIVSASFRNSSVGESNSAKRVPETHRG